MPTHHSKVVGGSNAARVLACPASIDRSAKVPSSPSSSYAEEGTALHSAMEWLLDTTVRRRRKPEHLLGMVFNKHVITRELLNDAVIPAAEYFHEVIGKHGYRYEQEISASFPGIDGAFGTTDVVAFRGEDSVIIFDWKFGAGVPVSAKMNSQLMYYACCAIEHYDLWGKVKIIDMHICQPRVPHGNSRCVIDMKQLRAFKRQLIKVVNGPRDHAETGSHCRWCPASATCVDRLEDARRALAWKSTGLGKDLAAAMELADKVNDWIKDVTSSINTCLTNGGTVPGYKLVEKRATRKWAIDDAAVRKYLHSHGLTEDQFAPRSIVTAPQAEKLLKPLGAKLESSKIKVESSGYTVAPESDNRPAVSTRRDLDDLASFVTKQGGQDG